MYVQNVHIIGVQWPSNGTPGRWKPITGNMGSGLPKLSRFEPVFDDDDAITIRDEDSDPHEVRFVSIGTGAKERVLVVVYCYRGENIRIISARLAEPRERSRYEESR